MVGRETARGNDTVNVGMQEQVLSPGVESADVAGPPRADAKRCGGVDTERFSTSISLSNRFMSSNRGINSFFS